MPARYRYCSDAVFLASAALYALNRWCIKPLTAGHTVFFSSYFNDLLCIPLWLPVCLFAYRRLGVRWHDGPPTRFEVLSHLAVWSLCFEWLLPHFGGPFAWTVADPWDIIAYAVGAVIAGYFWRTWSPSISGEGTTKRAEATVAG